MTERPTKEYGLMIDRSHNYGTDYVEVHVVRREPGKDFPLGCDSDGEGHFADTGTPKHMFDMRLDGLGMYGFVSEHGEPCFIGTDVEYRNVFAMDERKLRGMVKTVKRVNDKIEKLQAREPGDRFMAFASAFKLSFAVHRIGPKRPYPEWRWMSLTEGRNYYRDQIAAAIAETVNRKKGVA